MSGQISSSFAVQDDVLGIHLPQLLIRIYHHIHTDQQHLLQPHVIHLLKDRVVYIDKTFPKIDLQPPRPSLDRVRHGRCRL